MEDGEDNGTFSLQYRAAPVMVGGGRVVDGSDGNHNHIEYGVSEYHQVDGDQGKNKGCEPSSMTPSSGIKGGQQQQVKTSKSAVASLIGLCIPDEGFRSRERDFQMHVLESLSMETAHEEYFSFASKTYPAVVSSGHLDDGNIIGINPDVMRRLAIDYEGSKALQGIILSRGKVKPPRMTITPSWRVHRATEPLYDDDDASYDLVIDRMFDALSKDIVNLCLDMYGNYTVQCLLMEASPSVASQLGDVIVSNLLPFSLNFYGCRVVQCAMKHMSMEYRKKMCDVLEPFALHCLQSQNANHVIDALLRLPERDRPEHVIRIHTSICHYAPVLAKHKYGVTVLKTALESDIGTEASKEGTRSVLEALGELVYDEYGNYLVQNLIQGNLYGSRHAVHEFLLRYPLLPLACDKFGSNVFETLLLNSTAEESDAVILAFLEQCQAAGQTDEMVANIAMNRYGNYVVQRMLTVSSPRVCQTMSMHLALHYAMLAGSKHGKHIAKKILPTQ
ncbi:Pumilio-like protein 3 [Picochlorum sp. SENEW3]|nr:Pumilio-like protein 3 [Picochlorum sp. SENEW3]